MIKYPAIWLTETVVDSSVLLNEFEQALTGRLQQVYLNNIDWTGITVLSGACINHLESLPRLAAFLDEFGRENVLGVTYFNLAAHSKLHRHRDMNGNLLFGVMRLHIPLRTNQKAIMEVQNIAYHMPLDTLWALDTSGLHGLVNDGEHSRIHLVVDVKYGRKTARYFPRLTFGMAFHFVFFLIILVRKILRDLATNPASLLTRLKTLTKRFMRK